MGTAAATPRRGAPKNPWLEVEEEKARADALEAELAKLKEEIEAQEAAAAAAECEAVKAEERLTTRSAEMLDEYSSSHSFILKAEEELATLRQQMSTRKAENYDLARKNLLLDRDLRVWDVDLEKAQALVEQTSNSQGGLDAQVQLRRDACERVREKARAQGERLAKDLKRFASLKAMLQELVESGAAQSDAAKLVAQAEALLGPLAAALAECEEVAKNGSVPDEFKLDLA